MTGTGPHRVMGPKRHCPAAGAAFRGIEPAREASKAVEQRQAAQSQRLRLDMLEAGQHVAEANGATEQAARRHFHLEVMEPLTRSQERPGGKEGGRPL